MKGELVSQTKHLASLQHNRLIEIENNKSENKSVRISNDDGNSWDNGLQSRCDIGVCKEIPVTHMGAL